MMKRSIGVVAGLMSSLAWFGAIGQAQESVIPNEMVYVGPGPSVMGLDQQESADSGKTLTAYAVWLGGTGTYVDRLTVGEKRVIRGGSWIAPDSTVRSTHRFWNHPLNNSYGVGLGFRCAMNAPADIEQKVRDTYIAALVDLGRERFAEADETVTRGLALDPKNIELLELRLLIQQSVKQP